MERMEYRVVAGKTPHEINEILVGYATAGWKVHTFLFASALYTVLVERRVG